MKSIMLSCLLILFVSLCADSATAAGTLMEKLEETGWDGIIGTWVDEATGGRGNTTTYSWKLKDRVIEVHTKEATKEVVSLIGVNGKNGQLFHMGADNQGASFLGEWKFDADRGVTLGMLYTSADGQEGALQIRQKMIGKDKMETTIQLAQPLRFTMVRQK